MKGRIRLKKIKAVCVAVVAVFLLCATLLNIFYPERPTVSERENRTLASFPKFTLSSLLDGSFFSGIDSFVSDNFIGREMLVDVAQKIKGYHSLSAFMPKDEEEVVFLPSKTGQTTVDDPSDDFEDKSDLIIEEKEETEDSQPTVSPDIPENIPLSPDDEGYIPPQREPIEEPENGNSDIPVETPDGEDINQSEDSTDSASEESVETEETVPPEEVTDEVISEPEPVPEIPQVPSVDTTVNEVENNTDSNEAEFLSDGYIIYRNAVYSIPYLVKSVAKQYGEAIDRYSELFPESRVSILVAPLSSGMIDNESIKKKITNQKSIIDSINSYCGENINKINVYDALYAHRNEHIYFSSDHHWTALGAYYAYAEFARSVGLEPTPIEEMEKVLLNSAWKGTAYSMTGDERTKEFSDELYAYLPTKDNTMTVYAKNGTSKKNGCIRTSYKSYTAFIDGDNPYTIISVPDNPSDMTVLVLKDSYGCAFVPYLCEHYRTIIVADPRHVGFDLYDLLKDYPLKDIIFMTNIFNPNVSSWVKNVNRIIGN